MTVDWPRDQATLLENGQSVDLRRRRILHTLPDGKANVVPDYACRSAVKHQLDYIYFEFVTDSFCWGRWERHHAIADEAETSGCACVVQYSFEYLLHAPYRIGRGIDGGT